MTTQTLDLSNRYHIIESESGPLISESRMTVYDVLEEQNYGKSLYEISMDRNLSPLQVQVAFDYIEQHRERLQKELDEIIETAERRKRYYEAIVAKREQKIAEMPMTPQRAAFYALRDQHLAILEARQYATNSQ